MVNLLVSFPRGREVGLRPVNMVNLGLRPINMVNLLVSFPKGWEVGLRPV